MSLELTGICMNGIAAIEFMERLPDVIPEEARTEEFCDEFEAALNRFRYAVARDIPVVPKCEVAKRRHLGALYSCGECGHGIRADIYKRCPQCGRPIKW